MSDEKGPRADIVGRAFEIALAMVVLTCAALVCLHLVSEALELNIRVTLP